MSTILRRSCLSFAILAVASGCGDDSTSTDSSATEPSSSSGATTEGSSSSASSTATSGTSSSDTGSTDDGTADTGGSGCDPALPTFADGQAPTATLYVDAAAAPDGDGSEAQPFDTVSAGLAAAVPGTEVRISGQLAAGAYTTGLSGTADAPIWIRGEAGASIGPLTLDGASHIIVEDLEIAGSPDAHVLHFFFADHVMFRRLRIHDAGLGCIKGSQTTDAYVEDVELWAAGLSSSHPLLDFVGVNNGHIVRSEFRDGPGVMVMLKGGTSDMLFAWNEIHGQTAPGNALALGQSTGPQFFQPIDSAFEGLRIVAFANLLHDLVGAPIAFEGCKDCAAVHNTAWDMTGAQLVRFLPGAAGEQSGETVSKPEGCRFAGNILVGGQADGASLNADADNVGPNNVIDYNVFLKPGALNWWGVIEQDMVSSTYDEDPQLSAAGVPGNVALVDMAGPPDLDGVTFSELFTRDAAGECVELPADIGAIDVP